MKKTNILYCVNWGKKRDSDVIIRLNHVADWWMIKTKNKCTPKIKPKEPSLINLKTLTLAKYN